MSSVGIPAKRLDEDESLWDVLEEGGSDELANSLI